MSPRPYLAAALALALAAAPRVRGDDAVPLPPPPGTKPVRPAPRQPAESLQLTPPPAAAPLTPVASAPAPAVPAAPAPAPQPAFRWAGTCGMDFGFDKLLEVEMTDGSTQSLPANQGFFLSLGATFLPLLDGRLETQATIGLKYWAIEASNGNASMLLVPIEVLEAFRVDPVRLSAGLVYVPSPSMKGDGVLSAFDVDFDSSLGVVLQAEWVSKFKNGRGQLSGGPRVIWQKFQLAHGGPVFDATALGFVTSIAFR